MWSEWIGQNDKPSGWEDDSLTRYPRGAALKIIAHSLFEKPIIS